MSTYTNFITSSNEKCLLASTHPTTNAAKFYHTIWHIIKTSIITIILASALQPAYNVASAEYFSSVDSLQKLGDVEMGLLQVFRDYLEVQDKELESYRRFVEDIKLQHSKAVEDVEDYLGNPINAFTLIKRMVTDWNNLNEFIKQSKSRSAFQQTVQQFNQPQKLPTDIELKSAVQGLVRLQKVYNLSAYDLANGKINDRITSTELTWNDCYEIATYLFDQKEHLLALPWFEMAEKKLNKTESAIKASTQNRFSVEILEYLALSNYESGNSQKAVEYIDEILKLSPNHHTKDVRIYIMHSPPKQPTALNPKNQNILTQNYTRLCQGKQLPQKSLHKLKCFLVTQSNPQFILAPLKVEQLSKDPEITAYHGLLSNVQIERILNEAENQMTRSVVVGDNSAVVSESRVSQQAWLSHNNSIVKSVYRIVEQITGFDLMNSEMMQVANYGIGGQYDPHYDFLGSFSSNTSFIGDRISTNIFYLSNVEQGGFTVFPRLDVFSRPVKGSMISWHNLHRSLDPDYRTLHAGCPVITGSKKIGNVWIHSGFQEFRRPCSLESDTYKSQA